VSVRGRSYSALKAVFLRQSPKQGEYVVYGKKFVLCHWLSTPPPSIGEQIEFIGEPYAMYIGNTNLDGEVLPVWDCGNVIKSNTVTITTTNYPPQPATTKNL
jgi:hypothetical protein